MLQTMTNNMKVIKTSTKGNHNDIDMPQCSQHPPPLAATMTTAMTGLNPP
jgi:hypothetical protein